MGVDKFDVVFVFSVSMWIHLNHGETGLQRLFENCQRLTKTGGLLVLEPQPWKCYMTAARRMRKLNQPKFEHLESISHRQDQLLPHIIKTCETAGFHLVCTLGETHWKRPIYLFKLVNKWKCCLLKWHLFMIVSNLIPCFCKNSMVVHLARSKILLCNRIIVLPLLMCCNGINMEARVKLR